MIRNKRGAGDKQINRYVDLEKKMGIAKINFYEKFAFN
jgi:hypothetical protein